MTFVQSFSLPFPLLFHVISTLYLSFHLDSLHRHPDSHHFLCFHPDSPQSHADSPHPHSHSIPRIFPIPYSPHFCHSVLQFTILAFTDSLLSLYSLRISFRKLIALVQKRTLPFLLLHNSRQQIIIYITYGVISVITKNYLLFVLQIKNL